MLPLAMMTQLIGRFSKYLKWISSFPSSSSSSNHSLDFLYRCALKDVKKMIRFPSVMYSTRLYDAAAAGIDYLHMLQLLTVVCIHPSLHSSAVQNINGIYADWESSILRIESISRACEPCKRTAAVRDAPWGARALELVERYYCLMRLTCCCCILLLQHQSTIQSNDWVLLLLLPMVFAPAAALYFNHLMQATVMHHDGVVLLYFIVWFCSISALLSTYYLHKALDVASVRACFQGCARQIRQHNHHRSVKLASRSAQDAAAGSFRRVAQLQSISCCPLMFLLYIIIIE